MKAIENNLDLSGADEITLLNAAKDGDLTAFEELIRRHDRQAFRLAQRITQHREDAEDVVQEAFLKAFRGLARFQMKSRFATWLFRITVNECLMKLRKRRWSQEISLDQDDEGQTVPHDIVDWRPNPEALYGQSELKEIMDNALQELSPMNRTVFLLRDVEGFSIDDTAEMLDLTTSAVKARLLRARLKLRERLSSYFGVRPIP